MVRALFVFLAAMLVSTTGRRIYSSIIRPSGLIKRVEKSMVKPSRRSVSYYDPLVDRISAGAVVQVQSSVNSATDNCGAGCAIAGAYGHITCSILRSPSNSSSIEPLISIR